MVKRHSAQSGRAEHAAGPGAGETADPLGRWRALAILATSMLLAMTTWFSATAVLPQLRELWDLSSTSASWLTIAVQLGFVTGALISAAYALADVIHPRRFWLIGSLGAALANLGLLVAGGGAVAIALRFLTGMFLAAVYPPALKAMSTWFKRGRGTALGVMVGALTLGSAVPHLINGFGGVSWQVVVISTSVLTAVGGIIAEYVGSDGPFEFPRARFDVRQARRVFADRGVRLASFGYFGHMWELYAMWAWFAAFFASVLSADGYADTERGAALATFFVIGIGAIGCWVGGIMGDRWGRTRTTMLAMAISGAMSVTIGPITALPAAVVFVVGLVWGFWVVADSAQFSTVVTEVSDQTYVGTGLTLQLAIGFTLTVVTIWLIPAVVDWIGWTWAFVILAPGPAFGIASMNRLRKSPAAAGIAGGRG